MDVENRKVSDMIDQNDEVKIVKSFNDPIFYERVIDYFKLDYFKTGHDPEIKEWWWGLSSNGYLYCRCSAYVNIDWQPYGYGKPPCLLSDMIRITDQFKPLLAFL